MVDNDFNIIKPVDGLQNITGLTPIKDHNGKKKRQYPQERKGGKPAVAEQNISKDEIGWLSDTSGIDYRA